MRSCSNNKSKAAKKERGAVLALVTVLLFFFIGMAAIVIDLGHLYVVVNELQNAADAAALAGAQALYETPCGTGLQAGQQVNTCANQVAYDTAIQNKSDKVTVDVNWTSGENIGSDIERGHWNPSVRTDPIDAAFTPSDSVAAVSLFGVTTEQLYQFDGSYNYEGSYPVWVNAVKATVRREDTPAQSFFAKVLGYDSFDLQADAIAYIGFAGGIIGPGEADIPIVICDTSITVTNELGDDVYECNIGRMINSGGNIDSFNTAAWTDFEQEESCSSGTNASDVTDMICVDDGGGKCNNSTELQQYCGVGNPESISTGLAIRANGGDIQSARSTLRSCWEELTNKEHPWSMSLPVVDCSSGHNVDNCPLVVGLVNVNLVWITKQGTPSGDGTHVPSRMASTDNSEISDWDWETAKTGECWDFNSQVNNPVEDAMAYLEATEGLEGFSDYDYRWKTNYSQTPVPDDPSVCDILPDTSDPSLCPGIIESSCPLIPDENDPACQVVLSNCPLTPDTTDPSYPACLETSSCLLIPDESDPSQCDATLTDCPLTYDVNSSECEFDPDSCPDLYVGGDPQYDLSSCPTHHVYEEDMAKWDCFVYHFQLHNVREDDTTPYAPLDQKSLYFMPTCEPVEPAANTGGPNFGMLARTPVLVE